MLNKFGLLTPFGSLEFFNALSATFTKRTDSFRIFIKLFNVLVGSFACGGGYGNYKHKQNKNS